MADFGELITAMVTPFNEDYSINYNSCSKDNRASYKMAATASCFQGQLVNPQH
jgi:hypothetical protein